MCHDIIKNIDQEELNKYVALECNSGRRNGNYERTEFVTLDKAITSGFDNDEEISLECNISLLKGGELLTYTGESLNDWIEDWKIDDEVDNVKEFLKDRYNICDYNEKSLYVLVAINGACFAVECAKGKSVKEQINVKLIDIYGYHKNAPYMIPKYKFIEK